MIFCGDCLDVLRGMDSKIVNCCVTSPPYYGLRDYGVPSTAFPETEYIPMAGLPPIKIPEWTGCLGLEPTPEMSIAHLVLIFREVWRVLRDDGTLWLNVGDSYAGSGKAGKCGIQKWGGIESSNQTRKYAPPVGIPQGLKPKDLIGIPWALAFALRADGWFLRQDIIWCLSGGTWLYVRSQKGDMPMTVKDVARLDPATVKL